MFSFGHLGSLLALVTSVLSWDINAATDRQKCQSHTANPLDGCDTKKTVFVNGASNSSSGFKTVQSGESLLHNTKLLLITTAVLSIPNNTGNGTNLTMRDGCKTNGTKIHTQSSSPPEPIPNKSTSPGAAQPTCSAKPPTPMTNLSTK